MTRQIHYNYTLTCDGPYVIVDDDFEGGLIQNDKTDTLFWHTCDCAGASIDDTDFWR